MRNRRSAAVEVWLRNYRSFCSALCLPLLLSSRNPLGSRRFLLSSLSSLPFGANHPVTSIMRANNFNFSLLMRSNSPLLFFYLNWFKVQEKHDLRYILYYLSYKKIMLHFIFYQLSNYLNCCLFSKLIDEKIFLNEKSISKEYFNFPKYDIKIILLANLGKVNKYTMCIYIFKF